MDELGGLEISTWKPIDDMCSAVSYVAEIGLLGMGFHICVNSHSHPGSLPLGCWRSIPTVLRNCV